MSVDDDQPTISISLPVYMAPMWLRRREKEKLAVLVFVCHALDIVLE